MSNIWVTADQHFSHVNIIKYEDRPFKDIEEMNAILIEKWNRVVGKQDKVFILGDIGLVPPETLKKYLDQMKGTKILVKGNHDRSNTERWYNAGIDEFYKYPILYQGFYLLSHEPVYMNKHTPFVNIFGHVHSHPNYQTWSECGVCVSVERHNYAPVNFEDINNYFIKKKGGKE